MLAPRGTLAGPLVVRLTVQGTPAGQTVLGSLLVRPIGGNSRQELPAARELEARVPGEVEVDLRAGYTWEIESRAEGLWSKPTFVLVGPDEEVVVIDHFRVGTLSAG